MIREWGLASAGPHSLFIKHALFVLHDAIATLSHFAKITRCYMREEGKTAGSLAILDLYLDLRLFNFTPGREQHGKEYQNV